MEQTFSYRNNPVTVSIETHGNGSAVTVGGAAFSIEKIFAGAHEFVALVNGERKSFFIAGDRDNVYVFTGGRQYIFGKNAGAGFDTNGMTGTPGGCVFSPMPGNIIKIACREGDAVRENDTLVIVEAMKMENPLRAPVSGRVAKIHNAEGDLVEPGVPIVEIEAE